MRQFDVPVSLSAVTEIYPSADVLLSASRVCDKSARSALVRLWLSEGIPFAFKARPSIYEAVRGWMGEQLRIHAKEVTIVGSGRQGFSLSPDANIGREFGGHSDLDFAAVSSNLFQSLAGSLERWIKDYTEGRTSPRNPREEGFWNENKDRCPKCLARGFIDPHKIPLGKRYPESQQVAQMLYVAHERLKLTPGAPIVRKISIRIYRDWESFVNQNSFNLSLAAQRK